MPTKTDRILSYLPGTFQVLPRAIVLYAVANAFGKELLQAENSLAQVMSAHWVDKADRGAQVIKDLELLAALYGLTPRKDDDGNVLESVEEFRTHLKRYVRTFLEGTVTVQGILRVTAEALGLQIADDDQDLDSWWNRQQKELITFEPRDDDATGLILGVKDAIAVGSATRPAQVKGNIKLSSGVNLQEANRLQLKIDSNSPVTIDLIEGVTDPTSISLTQIVDKINASLNTAIASSQDGYLTLTSPTKGATSLLEIQEVTNDAAEGILGISPRTRQGHEATAAQVTGKVDLSGGVSLNEERYLRLQIDGSNLGEIDLTAGNTTPITLDQIRDAINNTLTINVASHNNHFLTLTSPTRGFGSSIVFQQPAAQDAKIKLFGNVLSFYTGQDAQPARIVGKRELTLGVDLSNRAFIQLRIDTQATVTINCAGENPANTQGFEIVTKINQAVGKQVASYNGKFVTLTSPIVGVNAQIVLEIPATGDATEDIFGITPRTLRGEAATTARIVGTPKLETLPETSGQGVDLRAEHRLQIAVDGKAPVEIDLRSPTANLRLVTLTQLQNAINAVLPNVASNDGRQLFLASPTIGNLSSIAIAPLENIRRRRYVTRAKILNEAAQAVFGFVNRQSQGTPATKAQIIGERDLSRGVDLQQQRFLRISIDGQPPQEVDFASNPHIARPRAAMLKEIIAAINDKLGIQVASDNGKQLILTSANKIELLPSTEGDARDALIGNVSVANGSPPLPAIITGEVDLLAPVNLSDRQLIRLSIDGNRPLDIDISGSFPEQTFLNEIVDKINAVVHGLASASDSDRLQLTSPTAGEQSQLNLLPLRYLELIEYPPEKQPATVNILKHGDRLSVVHQGKDAEFAKITITAIDGVVGPTLVNEAIGWQIRLFTVLSVGDRAELWRDDKLGVQAKIIASTGETRTLPGSEILLGLIVANQTWIPFADPKNLSNSDRPILQLNNPFAPNLVLLRAANRPGIIGNQITVSVKEAIIPAVNERLEGLVGQIRTEEGIYRLLGQNQQVIAQLQPGKDLDLASYANSVVVVRGTRSEDEPLIVVEEIAHLFDVTLRFQPAVGELIEENYNYVTIGVSSSDEYSLVRQINTSSSSQLVKVEELDKATVLSISPGKSEWVYLDCYGSRFDRANFNSSYFPNGLCVERGVFNISRFVSQPPDLVNAVFTASDTLVEPGVEIVFDWVSHRSGAFIVNLPADLPDLFGGKFNEARFSQGKDEAEIYPQAVTEPATDAYSLVKLINQGNANHETPILLSKLVAAKEVAVVPLGWQPITIPFRKPQFLTLGRNVSPEIAAIDNPGKDGFARIYLAENGFNNLIELKAKVSGAWGNKIAVSVRKSGPAMYDVSIIYNNSRFENARAVVLGGEELPALTDKILQPGAIGVLQAKAAGVKVSVTRDRCGEVSII